MCVCLFLCLFIYVFVQTYIPVCNPVVMEQKMIVSHYTISYLHTCMSLFKQNTHRIHVCVCVCENGRQTHVHMATAPFFSPQLSLLQLSGNFRWIWRQGETLKVKPYLLETYLIFIRNSKDNYTELNF